MDTLEQAVERFKGKRFEINDRSKLDRFNDLQAYKFLSPFRQDTQLLGSFNIETGTYHVVLFDVFALRVGDLKIKNQKYLSTFVLAKLREEGVVAPELDEDKINRVIGDVKIELGIPAEIDIGKVFLDLNYTPGLQIEGQDFEDIYGKFKLAAEKFGYKVD